jgi:hypothetical protein
LLAAATRPDQHGHDCGRGQPPTDAELTLRFHTHSTRRTGIRFTPTALIVPQRADSGDRIVKGFVQADMVRYFSTHSDKDIRGAMLAASNGGGLADLPHHHLSGWVLSSTVAFSIEVNALWRFGCITASRRQPGGPQFIIKRGGCPHSVRQLQLVH